MVGLELETYLGSPAATNKRRWRGTGVLISGKGGGGEWRAGAAARKGRRERWEGARDVGRPVTEERVGEVKGYKLELCWAGVSGAELAALLLSLLLRKEYGRLVDAGRERGSAFLMPWPKYFGFGAEKFG